MSFAKLLVLILGLVAVGFAVKVALDPAGRGDAAMSEPARQLDNVRTKARELERDLQKKAERAGDVER